MKKIVATVLAVLMLVGMTCLFAGCTDNDAQNTQKPVDNTQAATATPTPTAPAKQTIVVGYTIWAPMNYFEGDELVGFDTDLAKAVFEDLGYDVVFKKIIWEQKYTELEAGTISCIWNGFTSNGEDDGKARTEYVDFSKDYMINKQVVVTNATDAAAIEGYEALAGKVGSAEKGSIGYDYLCGIDGVIVKDAMSQLEALQDMSKGGCDFVVLDEQFAKAYAGKGDYEGFAIAEALSSDIEYYAVGFKKGSELTQKVNDTFKKLAQSGKLQEIAEKYAVQNAIVTNFD